MSSNVKGIWFALFSALGFGCMPIFANFAYQSDASVDTVLTLRFLIAAIALWVVVIWRGAPVWIGWESVIKSLLLGIAGYAVMSYCYFSALTYISASLTSLLLYLYPLFVTIFSLLLGKEKWEMRKGLALLISTVGIGLLVGLSTGTLSVKGILLGASSGLIYSIFILVTRQVGSQVPVLTLTAYMVTGAFFALFAMSLVKGTAGLTPLPPAIGYIAAIALLSTVAAITLFNASLQLIGATKASILSTFEPVFTVLLAYLFFQEQMSVWQMAGGALILTALFLLQRPASQKFNHQVLSRKDVTG
ncbi:DMT family transporter [Effusibacillus consociatus]|uniref:DMT family transporter n=1 Tax=Effusibacillus consociatus TaxID=1117041 RepID=A0ABV9PWE1_9BACL